MEQIIFKRESEIFEKLVRDRSGRFFRIRFVVVERDGNLRGRVISCETVQELHRFKIQDSRFKKWDFCLPVWLCSRAVTGKGLRINYLYLSPYFNKFEFLSVVKIRAPALRVI